MPYISHSTWKKSRLQEFCNRLIDTWISGDNELLERLARRTCRLTVRMSTLKASGLGFLMNTGKIRSQVGGNTRELVNSTVKRWRRWCREKNPEFVRGNEHQVEAQQRHFG